MASGRRRGRIDTEGDEGVTRGGSRLVWSGPREVCGPRRGE